MIQGPYFHSGKLEYISEIYLIKGYGKFINIVINDKLFSIYGQERINRILKGFHLSQIVTARYYIVVDGDINELSITELSIYIEQKEKQQETHKPTGDKIKKSWFGKCFTKQQAIKTYRRLCKKYHPDTGKGNVEKMQEINNEYEIWK